MNDSIIYLIDNYVDNHKKQLKHIKQYHDKDKDMIISAQKIVKNIIIDRKLIIFGGLAIDYALRLKGSSIYYDEDLPDYDCVSDRNVDDAYDIGEILSDAGFENVKVIRAKHVETMRVRINLITIIDIGYIPTKYFNQYKFLIYDQLRILHPDIQRIDMHKAFCFPLNNAPMEDIFHRWTKDLERFNLYEQYYPISENEVNYEYKNICYKLPKLNYNLIAFNGFVAFAMFRIELLKYINVDSIPDMNLQFINKTNFSINIPGNNKNCHLVIGESIDNITGKKYNPILEIIPKNVVVDNVCIYEINMLSITKINNINIVNIQYLLLWFLFHYNFNESDNDKKIYGNFYVYTLQMIQLSMNVIKSKHNPFYPTLTFLGPDVGYIPSVQNPKYPINYTPDKINTRKTFDYNNFSISGEEIIE